MNDDRNAKILMVIAYCALIYFAAFSVALMFDHMHDTIEIAKLKARCETLKPDGK